MRHAQAVFALLLLGRHRPTGSFVLPWTPSLFNGNNNFCAEHEHTSSMELECRGQKRRCVFEASARHRRRQSSDSLLLPAHKNLASNQGPRTSDAARLRPRLRLLAPGEAAAETAVGAASQQSPLSEETRHLLSGDGVACLRRADTGSRAILVGVVHGKKQSVKLAEEVVRGVKPDVVMLELDAYRLEDLPRGKAQKTQDGLSWFTPDELPDEAASPAASDKKSAILPDGEDKDMKPFSFISAPAAGLLAGAMDVLGAIIAEEEDEVVSEMEGAVREARACGARVCLGDRDFEETKRQLVEAGLADSVDDERLDDPEALLYTSMSAAGKRKFASFDLEKPETRETARQYYAALGTVCDPRALSAMVSERDEVMARNLMALGGEGQTTVALLGVLHVDGIERILMGNGWQTQEVR